MIGKEKRRCERMWPSASTHDLRGTTEMQRALAGELREKVKIVAVPVRVELPRPSWRSAEPAGAGSRTRESALQPPLRAVHELATTQ